MRAAAVLVASAAALTALAAPSARPPTSAAASWSASPSPGRGSSSRPETLLLGSPKGSWRMKCPQGSIVGGVDARLTHRAVDMSFSGLLGSPVNPGITTTDEVVFTGTYAGGARRPTGFRPFIGCVPTAGGGRIPTAVQAPAAVKPGRPTRLRVRTVSFVNTITAVTHGCNRGERLVSSTHAVALRSPREPSSTQLAGVQSELVLRSGRLVASARLTGAARGLRAKLQIQAVCTRAAGLP